MAAAPLKIELVKTIRGKDKATFQGFVYTLTKSSLDVQQWVCENCGTCKARMHTKGDTVVRRKKSIEQDERIQLLVGDYENRDITTYLRGIAYNIEF